jgi:DNA-binding XRE family transcriptional regulator
MMAGVQSEWSDDDRLLAEAASAHFKRVREDVLHLGEVLRARREELGFTQSDLSSRTGIQKAEISRIEHGKSNPTWNTLHKITDALDLDVQLAAR